MTYHSIIIWNKSDDAAFRAAWLFVFGKPLLQKRPRQCRWSNKYMIGTGIMTEEYEAELKRILGRKVKFLDRTPRFWFDI